MNFLYDYQYPFILFYNPGLRLFVLVALIWTLIWKGLALWRAGERGDKAWFVALFVLNTLGILDIAYLYWFSKKNK